MNRTRILFDPIVSLRKRSRRIDRNRTNSIRSHCLLSQTTMKTFLLLFLFIPTSSGFMENFKSAAKKKIRPGLNELINSQDKKQLNLQWHVGSTENGFLSVKDMVIELGGQIGLDEDRMELPGDKGPFSGCSTSASRVNIISKGSYISMKGQEHVECERSCYQVSWVSGRPAGTLVCGFTLAQSYKRNNAVLPEGPLFLSFPVWTKEGLQYGQNLKNEVLEEIAMYTQKWEAELVKYQAVREHNPIMAMIHQHLADVYATKCDDLYDYSLDTIPEDDDCIEMQDDLLISKRGLIWKCNGETDVLIGQADVSLVDSGPTFSSFSTGKLRP